jgi:hypothetical protein
VSYGVDYLDVKNHTRKNHFLTRLSNKKGVLFHLAGIIAIIWFIVRVLPRPDRIRYPCQQMGIAVAAGYIAFWGVLWSAVFHSVGLWIKRAKFKTTAFAPIILVSIVFVFSITSNVFADNYLTNSNDEKLFDSWEPIPNEPIGTPRGISPGRVVWVWDPGATESNLKGFWWEDQNNNQDVINGMFSNGLKGLTSSSTEEEAWDVLFRNFNIEHGNGDIGYQPGEKIAIKVNLNNGWQIFPYIRVDNERDASPYVVKALLKQLIENAGIAQKDITVYDSSRVMANWFYHRVYYEKYPSNTLKPEFPNVHYVDSTGDASGREKAQASSERIYFADETGLYRTLPTCVTEAKYLINMPILKRHPIQMGVTLSGKNLFGTWIEPVVDVHDYHKNAFIEGNPAPQTDLLAHKHLGGKTLVYVADGLYATKIDHATIAKFEMYPFNNDWTNSLFFSQDPVAIDSVMYDFLHTEGCDPCEGSQNYLHQSAEPPQNTYDPEDDGVYLSKSLGVHEHWNKSVNIFSNSRYLGPSEHGIDLVIIGEENAGPAVFITNPKENYLYLNGKEKMKLGSTIIIGDIEIRAGANIDFGYIEKVELYINDDLKSTFTSPPYNFLWAEKETLKFKHKIEVLAYINGEILSDDLNVLRLL